MSDVKFQLEYEADDGGVKEMIVSLKTLDGGTVRLARDMGQLEDATKKAEKAQGKMAKGGLNNWIGDIRGKLSSIKNMQAFQVVTQGVGLARDAFSLATDAAASFLDTIAGAERDNVAMAHVLGAEDAASVGKFLDTISDKTEFTENQLGGFMLELGRIGLAGKDLAVGLAAGLDLSALSGKGVEGMQGYINSLKMVSKTGMIGSEIFEMLGAGAGGESGKLDFFNELSARTGKSIEKLKKDLVEGKVAVADSMGAITGLITKRTGKDIGAIGLEQGAGLGAKLTQLRNLPERFIQDLAGGDLSGKLTGSFDKILTMFAPGSPFGKTLGSGLEKIVGFGVKVLERLPEFLEKLPGILEKIEKGGGILFGVLSDLWGVLDLVWTLVKPIVGGFGDLIGSFSGAGTSSDGLTKSLKPLADILQPIADSIGGILYGWAQLIEFIPLIDSVLDDAEIAFNDFVSGFFDLGANLVLGLVAGITGGIGGAVDAVKDLGDQVIGGLKSMLGIASPSKVFAEFGRMTGLGFSGGLSAESPRIDATMSKTFDLATAPFEMPKVSASLPSLEMPRVSATASVGGGSSTIGDVHINITEPGASADDIAATVTQTLMAKLQSMADGFSSEVPA